MPFVRALAFSICATAANWCAITIGVFVETALKRGMTSGLIQQLFRVSGRMLSPGWLYVTSISAGLSLVGWLIARRASAASGGVRLLLCIPATGLVGLIPACLAFAVISPPLVGLAIVLLVSGGSVVFAMRGAASSCPTPEPQFMSEALTQRAVFGRRGL